MIEHPVWLLPVMRIGKAWSFINRRTRCWLGSGDAVGAVSAASLAPPAAAFQAVDGHTVIPYAVDNVGQVAQLDVGSGLLLLALGNKVTYPSCIVTHHRASIKHS
ncbi:MAG TPA: hypothetical protein VHP83_18605 [Aggregatilineaceae bacterium]|nr:hypothetical protein [Aggregatilineaceae bacterium]